MKTTWKIALLLLPAVLYVVCVPFPPTDFEPSGTQFNISSNVTVRRIVGATSHFNTRGSNSLDLTGTSNTSGDESAVLPAGLILRSPSTTYAHMILLQDYSITVPAGHDTVITIGTFDCNSTRQTPSDADTYSLGPVTDNADLQSIAGIAKHKALGSSNVSYVQDVVWYVTNGEALRQASIDSLNALPEGPTRLGNPIITVPPGFFKLQKERALGRRS